MQNTLCTFCTRFAYIKINWKLTKDLFSLTVFGKPEIADF